jgi:hypothetical protein
MESPDRKNARESLRIAGTLDRSGLGPILARDAICVCSIVVRHLAAHDAREVSRVEGTDLGPGDLSDIFLLEDFL